jgi:hypothetical protein
VTLPRIVYRTLGAYDAAFEVAVEPDGAYAVERGSYVTHGRLAGRLADPEREALGAAAARIEGSLTVPAPAGADGHTAELTVDAHSVRWWGPPPEGPVAALVERLNRVGAARR